MVLVLVLVLVFLVLTGRTARFFRLVLTLLAYIFAFPVPFFYFLLLDIRANRLAGPQRGDYLVRKALFWPLGAGVREFLDWLRCAWWGCLRHLNRLRQDVMPCTFFSFSFIVIRLSHRGGIVETLIIICWRWW